MNEASFSPLAEIIKEHFPEDAKDLYDSIDLVACAFDSVYDSMTEKVTKLMKEQNLEEAGSYLTHSQSILTLRAKILEYAGLLEDEQIIEEEIASIEEDEEKERTSIPNYEEYRVNSTEPHNLYEDFTFTKACGFNFCGEHVEVANMKWVLVETCAILAQIDLKKMYSFLDDKSMKGRKVSYFSKESETENGAIKNEQIPGTELYVWTASSCNMTRNLIRKLLKKYNIGFNNFHIYLRADYTELHSSPKAQLPSISKADDAELQDNLNTDSTLPQKIGRHVQGCFDYLEEENFQFTEEQLALMQSSQWTLKTFGNGCALLREYNPLQAVQEQTKIGGYNRYWRKLYTLGKKQYFVNSQWFERQQERFDHWFESLNTDKKIGELNE